MLLWSEPVCISCWKFVPWRSDGIPTSWGSCYRKWPLCPGRCTKIRSGPSGWSTLQWKLKETVHSSLSRGQQRTTLQRRSNCPTGRERTEGRYRWGWLYVPYEGQDFHKYVLKSCIIEFFNRTVIIRLLTHPCVIPNLYDILLSVKLRTRHFEECTGYLLCNYDDYYAIMIYIYIYALHALCFIFFCLSVCFVTVCALLQSSFLPTNLIVSKNKSIQKLWNTALKLYKPCLLFLIIFMISMGFRVFFAFWSWIAQVLNHFHYI